MSSEPNNETEDAADLIEMGDTITITRTGQVGTVDGFMVIGRDEPQFWILYDAGGDAVSGWFRGNELTLEPTPRAAASGNVINFPITKEQKQ